MIDDKLLLNLQFTHHIPVLLKQVMEAFAPIFQSGAVPTSEVRYLDGTFGRGGHYKTLLHLAPSIQAVVFDQDPTAVQHANEHFRPQVESGQLKVVHANFSQFSSEKWGLFDMMLLDLGVSSPQLDEADRGFSFYQDGPLDMRMNTAQGETAEMIINEASENDLMRIFEVYGEVRSPLRVVRAIIHDRINKPFKTTQELASLIERVDGWRKKGFHPATLYFQGLRLAVNKELEVLEETLPRLMVGLKPGGRLAVITFHSLEDRIVKNIFRHSDLGKAVNNRVIIADEEEQRINPRSRSAKLRVFERHRGHEDPVEKPKYPSKYRAKQEALKDED